jgi:hypothetical protein
MVITMSKETCVFFGGMVLTVIPFLGIPEWWTRAFIVALGVIFILVGYGLRRAKFLTLIDRGNGERGTDSFVETTTPLFPDRTVE